MAAKAKSKANVEIGDEGEDLVLATMVANGDDISPLVRHAFEMGRPEGLLRQLNYVVKKKEAEIEEMCKTHYEEFIRAVDELRGVLVDAEELKSDLQSGNFKLQQVGTNLLVNLEELLETYSIKQNVTDAIIMSKNCIEVLELCVKCNNHITDNQFYPAIKTLDLIQRSYMKNIPARALKLVIERRIPIIKWHIEKRVNSQVNEWMVHIRSSCKNIGQTAISHAVSDRQRDEELIERQRKAEDQNVVGIEERVYTLDVEEDDEDSAMKFDLTPLYRACHIYVEDRVLRTGGGLLVPDQVDNMWETALSRLIMLLKAQFSQMKTAANHLMVKDYVTLLSWTLLQYGYDIESLLDVVDSNRDKFHLILMNECREQIMEVLNHDTYELMIIKKESDYESNVLSFGLQTTDIMPAFPYVAPFSTMVPEMCQIVRSFIKSCVDYLSYGARDYFFDVVIRYLNNFLIEVINETLLNTINSSTISVSHAMQIAANFTSLERACDFFLKHAAQQSGIPIRVIETSQMTLSAKSVLQTSRDATYITLLGLVNTKIDEYMNLTESVTLWTTEETKQNGNEYISELILYLDSLMSTAQQVLPLDAVYKVGMGALEHINNTVMAAFLSDSVKRFNATSVMNIGTDLKLLENFAEERFYSSGLDGMYKASSFRDCLVESKQLTNLLSSSQPENFMNPVIREKNYYALDYKKVSTICDKFRDSGDGIFGSLSNKNTKQTAKRKSMDVLKRRLKDFN
ncbi:hypothetical protein PIB30_012668 [Stylosanthes scabra]|uniref:Exocyst complex component n=1 Tax=Stylosanthes scabra TaxID=79078 RepID=A0ABU6Z5A1_9FABA|nr:hypothetical protein [Stylosanthes scabra]